LWQFGWIDASGQRVHGYGARTFDRYWYRDRKESSDVRDAHGLYIETLAELGLPGLGLLVALLATPLVVAARVRRRFRYTAAATGAYAVYLVHAGVDWDWELPGVTLTALFCGLLLLVFARPEADEQRRPWPPPRRAAALAGLV